MSMKPTEVLEMDVDKNDPKDVDKENEQSNKGGQEGDSGVFDVTKMINPSAKMRQEREDRRWSESLMKAQGDASQNMEDTRVLNDKGNVVNSNSFSILGNDIIAERSLDMGVVVNNDDLPFIDILAELEKAIQLLNEKGKTINNHQEHMENEKSDIVEQTNEESEDEVVSICSSEEGPSESEGFSLVTSKRERKKPNRLSLSGRKINIDNKGKKEPPRRG
jgi:hypothetical protein